MKEQTKIVIISSETNSIYEFISQNQKKKKKNYEFRVRNLSVTLFIYCGFLVNALHVNYILMQNNSCPPSFF